MRRGVILPCSRSMRMYGREKSAVVKPTKAVSVIRNTFNASTKNQLPSAKRGPDAMTDWVRCAAASSVARETAMFSMPAPSR